MGTPTTTESSKMHLAITVIGYILFFVAFFLALSRFDTFLKYKAIDDCARISRYETTDKNAKVTYPITDLYNSCLEDKGVSK